MPQHLLTILLLSAALALPALGLDPEPPKDKEYQARPKLVSEDSVLRPGQTHWVGLTFKMQDGWHIYWPGLNDSGFAPELLITVSDDDAGNPAAEIGEILWPAPTRYFPADGILDHVYEDRVTLLFPVTVPATRSAAAGDITLRVQADWLVCKEQCIPEGADLSITLRVSGDPTHQSPTGDAPLFTQARQRHPEPWPERESRRGPKAQWDGDTLLFTAEGASRMAFYPAENGAKPVDIKVQGEARSGELSIEFMKGDLPARGVLEVWTVQPSESSRVYHFELTR